MAFDINGVVGSVFSPLISMDPNPHNPILAILMVSLLISIITTAAQKLLVDQDKMKSIQDEMKEFQNEMREAQNSGDNKKLAELQAKQADVMKKQSEVMKMSFKPMIVTFIPILLVFYWMGRSVIAKTVIEAPLAVYYIMLSPIFQAIGGIIYAGRFVVTCNPVFTAYHWGWLGWYIFCTFAFSQIFRKYLGFNDGF